MAIDQENPWRAVMNLSPQQMHDVVKADESRLPPWRTMTASEIVEWERACSRTPSTVMSLDADLMACATIAAAPKHITGARLLTEEAAAAAKSHAIAEALKAERERVWAELVRLKPKRVWFEEQKAAMGMWERMAVALELPRDEPKGEAP